MRDVANLAPFFEYPSMYQEYEKRVKERTCQFIEDIEKGTWDFWETVEYHRGEIDRKTIYELAAYEARKQIYKEVTDVYA